MKIGLIDVDGHNYPNLALMKISAWHKANGDDVEWWWSDLIHYDVVYMSKVFSDAYSPDIPAPLNADRIERGGTGYAIKTEAGREVYHPELDTQLPADIERITPDYSLYPSLTKGTAYGFLTRGCPRGCPWCHVGAKEGRCSRKVADLSDFWSGQRNIVLMDPNILACPERWNLLEQIRESRAYVDFNQGLDIRLADESVADILGDIRVKKLHFAWDNPNEDLRPAFERFTRRYRRKDPSRKNVYVLTNFNSTLEQDLFRVYSLRDLGFDPFVMIYNKPAAPRTARLLQRWCNNKIIFNAQPDFEKYDPSIENRRKGRNNEPA